MRTPDPDNEGTVPRRPHHVAPTIASVRAILVSELMGAPLPGGSDAGLAVTVNADARTLRGSGVHAEAWKVKDGDDLISKLDADKWSSASRPVTHVVINNPRFIQPHKYAELAGKHPDTEFVQLNHSGLAYLSIDDKGIQSIRQVANLETALHNVKVAGNNKRFCQWVSSSFGNPCLYLPNLYDIASYRNPVVPRKNYDPLRIGSFGAGRPWKNQLVAAEAALTIARRLGVQLELYVNTGHWDSVGKHTEARVEMFADLPNAKIVEVPWNAWAKFRRTVSAMDLLLSPSFDETFCVVVADGIAEGVPSVVTGAVEWAPRTWWSDPWDQASVAHVGMALLHDRIGAVHDGRQALTDYVETGTQRWISYLTK
jgi:glycosyltransferase involved in cell wall biosynthesis